MSTRPPPLAPIVRVVVVAVLGACSSGELCESGDCEPRVVVARQLGFATEQTDGVAEGFDLDGIVSVGEDLDSCNHPDYVAPDGRVGIDNQFAVLWSAIEDVIGDAVDGLLLGVINDGNLLFMMRLDGLDDPVDDDCVDVEIFLGTGQPFVGTDGFITSGQTFDISPDMPRTRIECGTVRDGVLIAGPFDGVIPISILDVSFDLRVYGAMIRGELRDDGSMYAVIGAGADSEQIIEVSERADYRLVGLVDRLVRARSDLSRDELGECKRLSATMLYDGTPAFVYEDPL